MNTIEFFKVNGYWKDDKSPIEAAIIKSTDEYDDREDDDIFFYGMSEVNIQEAIVLSEDTIHDFVITSYIKI